MILKKNQKVETLRVLYTGRVVTPFFSLFSLLFALFFVVSVHAAEKVSPVTAKARMQKDKLRIGDETWLLLQVDHPRKYSVTAPDPKTDISPFEIRYVEPIPVVKGANRVQPSAR